MDRVKLCFLSSRYRWQLVKFGEIIYLEAKSVEIVNFVSAVFFSATFLIAKRH